MTRWFVALSCVILLAGPYEAAGQSRGPRIRFGRVEFGIPFVDSFVTVDGGRTRVKVFSRGDIVNVERDTGTRVDVGIRSMFFPRSDAPPVPAPGAVPDLGQPQPLGTPDAQPGPATNAPPFESPQQGTETVIQQKKTSPQLEKAPPPPPPSAGNAEPASPLKKAEDANARGDYTTAEKLTSAVLANDENNHTAHSIRAAALIGRGEQERNFDLVRQGVAQINQAIKLGKQDGHENKRDYLVWMIGANQLATLDTDRRRGAGNARVVEDFTTQHAGKFPDDLKERVYHQQGFARLLLGKRAEAEQSFQTAARFAPAKNNRR